MGLVNISKRVGIPETTSDFFLPMARVGTVIDALLDVD